MLNSHNYGDSNAKDVLSIFSLPLYFLPHESSIIMSNT